MTRDDDRSVAELRRESERTRAELTQTVHALRNEISETADGVRRTISPANLKAEVSSYVADTGRGWLDTLKQQAMDNPMQALAAGTAIAVPAMRFAKSIPLPLLMIGAGLALTSPRVRQAVADKVTDVTGTSPGESMDRARDVAAEKLSAMTSTVEAAADQATVAAQGVSDVIGSKVAEARQGVAQFATEVADRAADYQAAGRDLVRDKAAAASQAATEALQTARVKSAETLGAARQSAETVVRDNALLVGGIGLAIGALLAASLPATRVEQTAMGEASDTLRSKVTGAAEETFDRVKSAAASAAGDMQAKVGEGVGRFADAATEKLRTVADDAVTTAFEPTRSPR